MKGEEQKVQGRPTCPRPAAPRGGARAAGPQGTKIIIIKNPTELLNCDLWVEGKVNLWAKPMVLNEEVTGILNRKCEIN